MSGHSSYIAHICPVCNREFLGYAKQVFCSKHCKDVASTTPLIDRFFRYVGRKQPNGCILWTGQKKQGGYGRLGAVGHRSKGALASRVSYELFVGAPIPDGLCVLHRCDNPPCINPVHLFLGTQAHNMADMVAKGRQQRGEASGRHILTNAVVLDIRRRCASGEMQKDVARSLGVHLNTVGFIVRRKTWRHI